MIRSYFGHRLADLGGTGPFADLHDGHDGLDVWASRIAAGELGDGNDDVRGKTEQRARLGFEPGRGVRIAALGRRDSGLMKLPVINELLDDQLGRLGA